MDQIFSHVVDHIALSGPSGTSLRSAITTVIPNPRPSIITYIQNQFKQNSFYFTLTKTPNGAHITAHENLRRRALGFSSIEHTPLPQPAWTLLEEIGKAGPQGCLQADLGPVVGLQANMVHHYIGWLSARRLIGKRRIVLQRPKNDAVAVTYTSVIVLARYAAQMMDPQSPSQLADSATDIRLQRVLEALRDPPYTRPERDLKYIAIPDSDRPADVPREQFQRRRHRQYRSLRTKLMRLGAVAVTKRKCVTQGGKVLGAHPCLKLIQTEDELGRKGERKSSHPLLAGGGNRFVAEVDIVEQIYRMLVEAGPSGISVPELHEYLDSKNVTSAPSKRVRTIINAISKRQPTFERQYFEGSAMYLRISLQRDSEGSEKRRKVGMTSLGERRQDIIMELLQERKVLILETLGREVARLEDGAILRVDPKVMRRLISDLVAQKRVKLITTARPTIKDNPRSQNLVLVALPDVNERGEEVKRVVTTVVNRSLYGTQDDARDSAKRARDGDRHFGRKPRKQIDFGSSSDSIRAIRKKPETSGLRDEDKEMEDDEELIIMYQANDSDSSSDDDESADEEDVENHTSNTKRASTKSLKATQKSVTFTAEEKKNSSTIAKPKDPPKPTRKSPRQSTNVAQTKTSSMKEGKSKLTSKRKASEKAEKMPKKRPRSASKADEESQGDVALKKQEEGKVRSTVNTDRRTCAQGDDAAIPIKNQIRNLYGSRIARLRAVDYGCLKGKLARVRRFHKTLYEVIRAGNGDEIGVTPAVQHTTTEAARRTSVLGRFTFIAMLKEMTVGEYAATVGIYMDHGDAIRGIEREKIVHVLDEMHDEITSNTASRQVQAFVQTMTKLELIQSDVDSQWLLSGAGIIRDFGRGLPSGVVPHGIVFSSPKAVEAYWLELEQFSRCKMSRRPIIIDLRSEEGVSNHIETHPVGDLYFPKKWLSGVHRLQKQEQLTLEIILQRLSGVDAVLQQGARLRTDNFINGKLQRFDVEELDKEMERVLKNTQEKDNQRKGRQREEAKNKDVSETDAQKKGTQGKGTQTKDILKKDTEKRDTQKEHGKLQQQKIAMSSEQLLLYSRYRTANPIPKWFLKDFETPRHKVDGLSNRQNNLAKDNSCLLQLTRTPSTIKGHQVRAAMPSVFDANHRRYFKTRAKFKKAKDATLDAQADLERVIPLIRAILRERAVAYLRNDAEGLDWKIIPSLARFELQQSGADLKETVKRESLRRAIVALCESTTVRAALDILSLKLVLRMHEFIANIREDENREPLSPQEISKVAMSIVNKWDSLDLVCSATVMELRDNIRHHSQVYILSDGSQNLHNVEYRRNVIRKEFYIGRFLHGRPRTFAHTIEMMASRFRRVADIRLFREVRYALLLSEPYGEMGEEGEPRPKMAAILGEGIVAQSSGLLSKEDKAEANELQGGPRASKECTGDDLASPCEKKRAIVEAERNEPGPGTENATVQEKRAVGVKRAEPEQSARPNSEGVRTVLDGRSSAAQKKSLLCYDGTDAPYCPVELVELVVCAVVRQPPHAQWKAECLGLLARFREKDLANARDKLILRGSISLHAEREKSRCCLQPCKNTSPAETMAVLRGDKGPREEWDEDLRDARDGCLEGTYLWRDLCSLEGPSAFACSFATSSTFFDGQGLTLVPEFEEDDDPAHDNDEEEEDEEEEDVLTRIKLYFQYGKEADSQDAVEKREGTVAGGRGRAEAEDGQEKSANVQPDGGTAMRQKVAHEIAECGRHGISLEALLQRLNPHNDKEKHFIATALSALLNDGGIRRFAVETEDEEWQMTMGVLYICTIQCRGAITAFQNANGAVDQDLLRRVRDEICEVILRTPGCKSGDLIHSVCAKHTSVSRRAVADILFSLEGNLFKRTTAIRQSGQWRILRASASFVDEIAILAWGTRCFDSYTGDAANFSQFRENEWKLSYLL